jgi:hypothetical protein
MRADTPCALMVVILPPAVRAGPARLPPAPALADGAAVAAPADDAIDAANSAERRRVARAFAAGSAALAILSALAAAIALSRPSYRPPGAAPPYTWLGVCAATSLLLGAATCALHACHGRAVWAAWASLQTFGAAWLAAGAISYRELLAADGPDGSSAFDYGLYLMSVHLAVSGIAAALFPRPAWACAWSPVSAHRAQGALYGALLAFGVASVSAAGCAKHPERGASAAKILFLALLVSLAVSALRAGATQRGLRQLAVALQSLVCLAAVVSATVLFITADTAAACGGALAWAWAPCAPAAAVAACLLIAAPLYAS